MDDPHSPLSRQDLVQTQVKKLSAMWAACCFSPIVYLGFTIAIERFTSFGGFRPISPAVWQYIVFGGIAFTAFVQAYHSWIRWRTRQDLAQANLSEGELVSLMSKRLMLLLLLSEIPVFFGFCLYLATARPVAVFGFGIAAMFLYAQSSPRYSLKIETQG